MLERRPGFRLLLAIPFLLSASAAQTPLNFNAGGATNYGVWSGAVRVNASAWKPGDTVTVMPPQHHAGAHAEPSRRRHQTG